ncbi:MAG TPA: hypothetical protein VHE81_15890, partial [Lacipirellulaceae bacterium]|nr:hypothetical protein [Lacipirellulaceae bacterium]
VTITQSGPGGTQTFTVAGIGNGGSALTLVSSQNINDPSAVAQPYTYTVDWGDGNVQTITLMLKTPGNPTVNGQTFINTLARTSGTVGVPTTGSFQIMHKYLGPPDPVHPTADIKISATIVDDNDGSVSDFTTVSNPGIQTINVAIDTTPQVPRLVFIPQQSPHMLLEQQSVAPQSLQPSRARIVPSEMVTTSDRYVELVVVSLDGTEVERYRLSDEALVDLRGLFAKLPDNRYRIYLFRADNNSRRLVMDVFVRRGRVIDPSDDSEGTRDRPPTNEDTQPNKAQQNGQQNAVPLQQQQQIQPTQNNLLLKPAPADSPRGASAQPRLPANGTNQTAGKAVFDNQPTRSRTAMNWVMPLAWLGLVASPESWSRRVGAALERADDRDWQRLRRAGRLGKMATKPRQERPEVTSDAV